MIITTVEFYKLLKMLINLNMSEKDQSNAMSELLLVSSNILRDHFEKFSVKTKKKIKVYFPSEKSAAWEPYCGLLDIKNPQDEKNRKSKRWNEFYKTLANVDFDESDVEKFKKRYDELGLYVYRNHVPICYGDFRNYVDRYVNILNAAFEDRLRYQKDKKGYEELVKDVCYQLRLIDKDDIQFVRRCICEGSTLELSAEIVNSCKNTTINQYKEKKDVWDNLEKQQEEQDKAKKEVVFAELKCKGDDVPESIDAVSVVKFCTIKDLHKKGISTEEVIKQIMDNDKLLYDFKADDPNAGKLDQWIKNVNACPQNWGFLYDSDSKKVVGNFSYSFIDDSKSALMKKGELTGEEITIEDLVIKPIFHDDLSIYIMNISANPEYDTDENWKLLWNGLATSVAKWIKKGILFNEIFLAVFKKEYLPIYKRLGFKKAANRKGRGWQEIWSMDLYNGFSDELAKPLSKEHFQMSYRQLSFENIKDGTITAKNLKEIAALIYDTDPYVYSALLKTRENALNILPHILFTNKDNMFSLGNVYACFIKDRVVGIILFNKGGLKWDSSYFESNFRFFGKDIDDKAIEGMESVKKEYFSRYTKQNLIKCEKYVDEKNENATVLLNFAMHKSFRHDKKYGVHFLAAFIEEHKEERLYLRAISEVAHDFDVYSINGFTIAHTTSGYSKTEKKPLCAIMIRDVE